MCLINTICVFQGLTPPLVTWLPSSWSCPCLFVLSSFMIWASWSSPSCLKYETLPFNAKFSWFLHGFKIHRILYINIDILPQAAKSLIYFFAEDKSAIYIVIAFSIFSPINTQPLRSSMTKVVGQGDNSKPIKLMLITNLSICRSFHSHSLNRKYCFSKCGKLWSYFYFNFQAHFLFHFQKL